MLRHAYGALIRLSTALAATLAASAAHAQEVIREPLGYSLKQYGLILGVSLLGGLASWGDKVRQGQVRAWHLMSLVGELTTASLAGLLCFWLCRWQGFDEHLTAALTGLAGYMGTRALVLFERRVERRYAVTAPVPLDPDDSRSP